MSPPDSPSAIAVLRHDEEAEAPAPRPPSGGEQGAAWPREPELPESSYPLTPLQQGMLFQALSEPHSGVDIEQIVICLPSSTDPERIRAAWDRLMSRHPILRTSFRWEGTGGEPLQEVWPQASVPVEVRQNEGEPDCLPFRKWLDEDRRRGFRMDQVPLQRLTLHRFTDDTSRLVWSFHHALLDGRSFPLLLEEFFQRLDQPEAPEAPRPRPFREFIEWQRARDCTPSESFWRETLRGFLAPNDLGITDLNGRPEERRHGAARTLVTTELTNGLKHLAATHGVTLNTIVQAAWAILLSRYSREEDVVFGATRACRHSTIEGADQIAGLFINTIPVRTRVNPEANLGDWLRSLRRFWVDARPHEHTPLARIQAWSDLPKGTPLFQSLVVFENQDLTTALRAKGAACTERDIELHEFTVFPVCLAAYGGESLRLVAEYDRARIEPASVDRMLGHLGVILQGMADNPAARLGSLPLLTAAEHHELTEGCNPGRRSFASPDTIVSRFERQAALRPHSLAASCEAAQLTYAQLNSRANQLAHFLRSNGVGPDTLVGVSMERSLDLLVALLGILKAGGAYLPIDLAYPADRLAFMLEDARAPFLLTQQHLLPQLPAHQARSVCLDDPTLPLWSGPTQDPPPANDADHLAYVIYTSGSTGKPKGVQITHRNVIRLFDATQPWFHFDEQDVWSLFHSYAFDFSVWEIWGALLYGGRVVVVPFAVSRSPQDFYKLLAGEKVTVLNQTPSAFKQLSATEESAPQTLPLTLRLVIFGGEALEMQSLRPWFDRHGDQTPQLVNMYGITETTVHVTYRPLSKDDLTRGSLIGAPIPDLQIYLLDSQLRPVSPGVPGEMFIGGSGLARGYLNRPELTAERFIANLFSEDKQSRLYRSGDLARRLPNGDIEYLGRIDQQVQLRGFRVELGEIESVLATHPGIREAKVILREDTPGEQRLAAYLLASGDAAPGTADLREHLRRKLPDYMVPAAFVTLEKFPLTNNGKLDAKALPAPSVDRDSLGSAYQAPRTQAETVLAEIWQQVLKLPRVGTTDNFFELGGDSILSIQIIARARAAGLDLMPKHLFKNQTIAQLAALTETVATPTARASSEPPAGEFPLTPIQHWFFQQPFADRNHWTQSFLFETRRPLDAGRLRRALAEILVHHPALRTRFADGIQTIAPTESAGLLEVLPGTALDTLAPQQRLDIARGPLLQAVLWPDAGRLFLTIHHLAVDGVSWRILLEDLEAAYNGRPLPAATAPFDAWSHALQSFARSPRLAGESAYWRSVLLQAPEAPALPADVATPGENLESSVELLTLSLDHEETRALLREVPAAFGTRINAALLTALASAFRDRTGNRSLFLELEGHGREHLAGDLDTTRTAGWFTSLFPVLLRLPASSDLREALPSIQRQLDAIPSNGVGFGVLRHLSEEDLGDYRAPDLVFNHLGQFDQVTDGLELLRFAPEPVAPWHGSVNPRTHAVEINTLVIDGCLEIRIQASTNRHRRETVEALGTSFLSHLRSIIDLARPEPASLPVETWPLTPMQRLFYSAGAARPNYPFDQWHARLTGPLDVTAFREAWHRVINRHSILRSTFPGDGNQHVHAEVDPEWTVRDTTPGDIIPLLESDRQRRNDLLHPPLSRLHLLRFSETDHFFLWSLPDLQMDGWSWPLVFGEVSLAYAALRKGTRPNLPEALPYCDYLGWLARHDASASLDFWKQNLAGFKTPTLLPCDRAAPHRAPRKYARQTLSLSPAQTSQLSTNARQRRLTAGVLVQAAWAVLLGRCARTGDVVFGTAFSGRPADLPGAGSIVGPFTNNLPVRVKFHTGDRAADFVASLQERLFDLDSHQFTSPLEIHDASEVAWKDRLFGSIVVFQNYEVGDEAGRLGDEVRLHDFEGPIHTNLDLTLVAVPGNELRFTLIYDENRCSPERASELLHHLSQIVVALGSEPDALLEVIHARIPELEPAAGNKAAAIGSADFVAPATELQRTIASVWHRAFGIDRIGIDDNFFDLGGHSLLLVRVHQRLCELLQRDFPIVSLFQHPTIASLANSLGNHDEQPTSTPVSPVVVAPGAGTRGVAIVGMALRVPGASTLDEFWSNLVAGTETITTFARDQLAPGERAEDPDYIPRRGVLTNPTFLDASFFGIKPKEAEVIDPQHRLFLEAAHEALETAGIVPREWPGSVGVYAGVGKNYYYLNNVHHNHGLREVVGEEVVNEGNEKDYIATRVAYKLDLTGPALNIHTACSTSLVAVCQAVRAVLDGDCDMALAGGAAIRFPQERGYLYEEGSIQSRDGHCRAFDAAAAGTVFSNGVGVVVLKRLEDAERDGDTIYAVVKGVGLNNDGANKVSFTAPSVEGQAGAIEKAIRMAGVDVESISYVEAHGTGTPLGDPIEVAALTKAFRALGAKRIGWCGLGSLKSATGHLDAAAGVCGLIKTALALHHKQIPATLHFTKPNPKLGLETSPFRVVDRLTEWSTEGQAPRRAGVSALGVGGTNAHVILEEAPVMAQPAPSSSHQLLVLSAKTETALETARTNLAAYLESHPAISLADAAFTLQAGRQAHTHRCAIVAASASEAAALLKGRPAIQHQTSRGVPVLMLFPGQGAQYPGMGEVLYHHAPVFKATVDRCAAILEPVIGLDLRELLYPSAGQREAARELLKETRFTQPAIFATSYAMVQHWLSWGITPSAMLGHSVGEYVAAALAGVFSLEDALVLVARRALLVQSLPGGAMLAVRLPETEVTPLLPDDVDLAALNSQSLTVVAGSFEAIERFEAELTKRRVASKRLPTSHAFHSRMMEPVIEPFQALFKDITLRAPAIPFVSNVTGRWVTAEDAADPAYWAAHIRQPVRFTDGLATLFAGTTAAMLEAGPGTSCATFARQHPDRNKDRPIVSTLSSPEANEQASALDALGKLWLGGVNIDWRRLHESTPERHHRIPLPTYPFERQNYCAPPAMFASPPPLAAPTPAPTPEPVMQPSTAPAPVAAVSRLDKIIADLKGQIHEISGTALSDLHEDATFLDLGFDSLFLTQASLVFRKRYGVRITFRQLMEDLHSIRTLASHLVKTLPPDRFAPVLAVAPQPAPAPAAQAQTHAPATGSLEARVAALESAMAQLMAERAPVPVAAAATVEKATPSSVIRVQQQDANSGKKLVFGPFRPVEKGEKGSLTPAQQAHVKELIASYNARTGGSKRHTQKYRAVLADPRAAAGFNPLWKDLVYPIVTDRSEGSKVWDIDGNEYVDVTLGFGLSLFGHRPKFVQDAIKAQLDRGLEIGPSHPLAGEVAEMVREFSGMERVSFCNTGSEAVMAAIRIARTVTGRDKIAMFAGAYHGIFDEVIVRPLVVNGELRSIPIAPGITNSAVQEIFVLEYGNPASLEILRQHGHDIAAILVETVQSRRPELQPVEFLRELRAITCETETALVFDEVVTGFRAGPGGNQERFGIRADIVTYGKIAGGGLPIGVLAGSKKYMDALDGGFWQYGDDSFPEVGVTFFAGTFVRHPLALAAAKAVLTHLKKEGPALQQNLEARTTKLVEELNCVARLAGVPIQVKQFSSLYFLNFAPELKHVSLFFVHMRRCGIHIWESRPSFISTAHSDGDVQRIVDAFRESIEALQDGGFLPMPEGGRQSRAALAAGSIGQSFPLTPSQEELFLAARLSEGANLACNESFTVRLSGGIDLEKLKSALRALPDRHENLRTTFAADGSSQRVAHSLDLPVEVIDLTASGETGFEAFVSREITQPFDLAQGPLLRASIAKLSETDHRVVLTGHHIVCDGWSFDLLSSDLAAIYSGQELPAATPFRIYAAETAEAQRTPEFSETEAFWLGKFRELPDPLVLPADKLRPRERTYRSSTLRTALPDDLNAALHVFCRERKLTPYTVLLAAYQLLLHRLSRQEDLIIGAPIAGQPASGHEGLCGHCVNFLPMRLRLAAEATVGSHLAAVRSEVLDAMEHQGYTLGQLTRKLHHERQADRPQVVTVTFTLEPEGSERAYGDATGTADVNPKRYLGFDLSLFAVSGRDGLRLLWVFSEDILSETAITRWAGHFEALLRAMLAADPASPARKLPMLSELERRMLLVDWNATTQGAFPQRCVQELFEEQAAATPLATALLLGDARMTYQELNELANGIAARLTELGVQRGTPVAVITERSFAMIASLIGVLKAGGAYLPVDPDYPAERMTFMLADSGAPVVITPLSQKAHIEKHLPARVKLFDLDEPLPPAPGNPAASTKPHDLAYIIYTSGSTGRPKGTTIPHAGVVRLVRNTDYASFSPSEVFLQAATVSFDASTFEIWGALLNGASLALLPPGKPTLEEIGQAIAQHRVTTAWLTAGLFQMMVEERLADLRPLRQLLAGGDVLPREQVRAALGALPQTRLINGYGPTENTTFTCCLTITAEDLAKVSIPIGKPVAHTQVYILDELLEPVPIGVPGELYIGGAGLATGYLNLPELTAEKFIADPFSCDPQARLYRSGDLCRWLADGMIEFLGRMDNQLKVRGFRIEPGEIEKALASHPTVNRALVAIKGAAAGQKTLVAYVTPSNGSVDPQTLRAYLREHLPEYMVPSAVMSVPAFPVTPNGKIDYRALPEPDGAALTLTGASGRRKPSTPTEKALSVIWSEVLGVADPHCEDNFFDAGGHSLLGLKLFTRIGKTFDLSIPLASLFRAPTIGSLAAIIDAQLAQRPTQESVRKIEHRAAVCSILAAVQPEGRKTPFFGIHGGDGGSLFYRKLARKLPHDRPFYAIEAPALIDRSIPLDKVTIPGCVSLYLDEMKKAQPDGPYLIGGYSFGGVVAWEIAQELLRRGEEVLAVVLLDTANPHVSRMNLYTLPERIAAHWRLQKDKPAIARVGSLVNRFATGVISKQKHLQTVRDANRRLGESSSVPEEVRLIQVREANTRAFESFVPEPLNAPVILLRADLENDLVRQTEELGWEGLTPGGIRVLPITGGHLDIFKEPHLTALAQRFTEALSQMP